MAGATGDHESPTATAIVVNYNGRGIVEEAVESLLAQDLPGLEVVVVDNGSTDGSDLDLERRFGTRLQLLRAGRNLGFGAGNNLAIRRSGARHVILLNNDAVAAPSFARLLVEAAESDPRLGMVAAKVLDYERRDVIDTVGHLLYLDGLNRGRGRLEVDRGQYDDGREALFPSGAAALYRRVMLDEIGLFDEGFFLYGDDAELGLRGRLAGWGCALAPRAVAFHRYSQTAGRYSALKAFYVERNRVFVLFRIFPVALIAASLPWTAARLTLAAWAALTGRGAAGRLARDASAASLGGIVARAYWSALRGLPGILRKRWRERHLRRLGLVAFLALVRRFRLGLREVALKE